ncbi:PAS domain S-box-containing protein/diguanylate cyclase (GGDEF)-like protein [Pseudorhodoferax soli]|uniref:diguanylate cyclase n=1 Tax=Pseudorhodoferax soli TaxID=545864 RepID=A0A368XR42_9BURK|nr:PAS domain S-box-containing protein/diguanylate cyclase (GGDEF)-like protein [Pseudorhodoferax soli]
MLDTLLHAFGAALDGLEVAYCAFDSADRTLAWNATFLEIFPEHDGKIHAGEPYAENLRRFYAGRLTEPERVHIGRYIEEGLARHRAQRRPYEFDHRDARVRVSSLEMGRFGRVRVWRRVARLATVQTHHVPSTQKLAELNATAVLERLVNGVLIVDLADRCMWANQAFLKLYGLRSAETAVGLSFEAIYRDAWQGQQGDGAFLQSMLALRENQRCSGAPFELALPGDRFVRVVEQRGEVDGRGYFEHSDITDQRRQQAALAEAERRYRLLAEFSSDLILSIEGRTIAYASPSLTELLGWTAADVVGRSVARFCHPQDFGLLVAPAAPPQCERMQADYRVRAKHKNGSYVWVEGRVRQLPGQADAHGARRIVNLRGIDARKAVEEKLERAQAELKALATTDALTGLANRRKLDEVFGLEFRRALREGMPLTVLVLDIDHFKRFNDVHGHQQGDNVLRSVGAVLQKFAERAGDLAVRLGGEEFVLVLPATEKARAVGLATKILEEVRAVAVGGAPGQVTASIGVATLYQSSPVESADALLELADRALYAAKHGGRNRFVEASTSSYEAAPRQVVAERGGGAG